MIRHTATILDLIIFVTLIFIAVQLMVIFGGCVTVERIQVGPADWPSFSDKPTTRPSYVGSTGPLEVDTQTAQEIIDELFGDFETTR